MKRKGHIFRKYVILSTATITLSFLLLGVILVMFISEYWQRDKSESLTKTSQSISYLAQNNLLKNNGQVYMTNFSAIQGFMSIFSKSCDADLMVVDSLGNVVVHSDGIEYDNEFKTIPQEVISEWIQQAYCRNSDLGGVYDSSRLIASYPVEIVSRGKTETVAIVFAVASSKYFDLFLGDATEAVVLIFILVFLLSSIAIVFFNYQTYKPLKEISAAVVSFTKGDFSKRVYIHRNDEIGDLAAAFNNMAESLSISENTRRNFIANVSHELKTPMTTIAGFVDGIRDKTIPVERQDYYLAIVSEEVKRLSRLVKMMLNLSRIDNGELVIRKEQFNITQMTAKILIGFEKSIENKNINIYGLENATDVFLLGDYDMMYQVMYNLIENAVKFTNDSGYICFDISSKNTVNIKIKNSGQGISKDDMILIFDRFYKTDKSRSKDKNGMGLGLYIVKKIINLHGGDITVDSIEGEYCEFAFWIPKKH